MRLCSEGVDTFCGLPGSDPFAAVRSNPKTAIQLELLYWKFSVHLRFVCVVYLTHQKVQQKYDYFARPQPRIWHSIAFWTWRTIGVATKHTSAIFTKRSTIRCTLSSSSYRDFCINSSALEFHQLETHEQFLEQLHIVFSFAITKLDDCDLRVLSQVNFSAQLREPTIPSKCEYLQTVISIISNPFHFTSSSSLKTELSACFPGSFRTSRNVSLPNFIQNSNISGSFNVKSP